MTKEEFAMERNEVREILEGFSEELSQINLDKLSRVFCLINGDEKRIAELETRCNELFLQTCEQAEKIKELKEYNKYLKRKRQGGIQKQYNKVAIIKQQDDQLTKAKEIIKQFLNDYPIITKDLLDKLEQFISEMEK